MGEINKCLLCGKPYLAPDVPDCSHSPQERLEIAKLEAEAVRVSSIRERYLASLPPLYQNYLDAVPADIVRRNPQLLEDMQQMSERAFVFMHGEGGVGKTHLAVTIGGFLASKYKRSVLFVGEEDYFAQVERSYRGGPDAPDLLAPQILVYDDAGKKPPSSNAARLFYRLLEQRLAHMKATIITSNKSAESLANSLAEFPEEAGSILTRLWAGWAYEIQGNPDRNGRMGVAL